MQIFTTQTGFLREGELETVVLAVRESGLVVMPTDTVYGIGASPADFQAVARLQAAKGRGEDYPPPVLVVGVQSLDMLLDSRDADTESGTGAAAPPNWADGAARRPIDLAKALAAAFWPGPLTIIAPARTDLGWNLGRTNGTVALRMPAHPVTLQILAQTGPLAVTSANRHSRPPATNVTDAVNYFGDLVEVYVDAGENSSGRPSTIINLATGTPVLVREGAITWDEILQAI